MSDYIDSIENLREAVRQWHELLSDPFKAPEIKIGLPGNVFERAIETIVQYRIMEQTR